MIRAFYPASRAHHAYSMAIDFGMKFKTRNGFWSPEGLLGITGAGGYKIEVAEESLCLLEPRRGDWVKADDLTGGVISDLCLVRREAVVYYSDYCLVLDFDDIEVFERDEKLFMWPEFEL